MGTVTGRAVIDGVVFNPSSPMTLPPPVDPKGRYLNGSTLTGSDFVNNQAVQRVTGKPSFYGPGKLTMTPMSSTKAGTIPAQTTGASVPYYIYRTAFGEVLVFKSLTIEGTNQGHIYGGLMLDHCNDSLVEDVLVTGIPGNAGSQPGETFGVNGWGGARNVYRRVEVDGRRASDLVVVGASGLTNNSATDSVWEDCYVHDHQYGMPTFWRCTGIETRNLRSHRNVRGINHEDDGGRIRHYSPDLRPTSTPSGMHLTFNNQLADNPDIEVWDCRWTQIDTRNYLAVLIGDSYAGIPNKQVTLPKFFKADGTPLIWADAGTAARVISGISYPAVAAKNMTEARANPQNYVVRHH